MTPYMLQPDLHEALEAVRNDSNNEYAKTYASRHAIGQCLALAEQLKETHTANDTLHTQLRYIVSNLQYWRGDLAKKTKATLKSYYEKPCLVQPKSRS